MGPSNNVMSLSPRIMVTPSVPSTEDAGEFDSLFAIIQNQSLNPTEKNRRFAHQLKNRQLTCFKRIQLLSEFPAKKLTLAIGSANDGLLANNEAVARESLPFYVLDKNVQGSEKAALLEAQCSMPKTIANLTLSYEGSCLDCNKTILPKALRKEINSSAKVKIKAGVKEVVTLQEWAHGTIHSFNIQLPDPMPALCVDSYSLVTFVPVKEERTAGNKSVKRGQWDPFFKGQAGPKVLLTYLNDDESKQAQGGASGIVTHEGNYVVIQDSTKKRHHWSVEPVSAEEVSHVSESTLAKIKRAAVNFVIIPIQAEASTKRQVTKRMVSPSYGRAGLGEASQQPYPTTTVSGPHKVDAEGTIHVQVRTIPIDVSGIITKQDLEQYVRGLGKMMIELAELETRSMTDLSQEKPLTQRSVSQLIIPINDPSSRSHAATDTQKEVSLKPPEFIKHVKWLLEYAKSHLWPLFVGNQNSLP